jgi:hypothetical protein
LPALGNICIDGIGILSKGEEPPSFPKGAVWKFITRLSCLKLFLLTLKKFSE